MKQHRAKGAFPFLYLNSFFIFIYFLKILFIYLLIFREGKGEREGNINVWLPLKHPLPGTWSAVQACALTGN